MKYPVAERFKSIQGEGQFCGTPMAFIRFIGCSVGKRTCTHCDTNFDQVYPQLGGGHYTIEDLIKWTIPYRHVCLTGGEPLDRNLAPLIDSFFRITSDIATIHIETSGTRELPLDIPVGKEAGVWLTVSPKPGYLEDVVAQADEIKVILGGLGDGQGWPNVDDAVRWAQTGTPVYLQPRNGFDAVDLRELTRAQELVERHPELRLSVQLHKFLQVR